MPVAHVTRFERFFRAAAGLDVDKSDLKRYSDFIDRKVHDGEARAADSLSGALTAMSGGWQGGWQAR
jgi:hypothetical protein